MAQKDITAARLRTVLAYDPVTGLFTRRLSSGRWKAGTVAGGTDGEGYTKVCVDGTQHRAHRLAWLYVHGVFPVADIDHRNGVRTDNRIANLRDVSRQVNLQNVHKVKSTSTSGLLGALRHKSGLWRSAIRVGGRPVSLGYFRTPEEAHQAYRAARALHFPDCAV